MGLTFPGGPGTSATNHRRVVSGASVRHERRPLEPRTAADSRCHDFPSEQVQEPHAPSHLQSQSMWSGNQDWQESPVIAREHIAVQALTALPGNPSTSIVDLTGNDGLGTSGQQTLDEQEEAQVQMAIAMSLAENEAPRNASDVVLGRPGEPGEFSWQVRYLALCWRLKNVGGTARTCCPKSEVRFSFQEFKFGCVVITVPDRTCFR